MSAKGLAMTTAKAKRREVRKQEMTDLLQLFVSRGVGTEIPADFLAARMNTGERHIRRLVRCLRYRLRGGTIVSGQYGYKLTVDPSEIQSFARLIEKHSLSQLAIAGKARRAAGTGQIRLDFDVDDEFTV